jgi:hypothetical protein
MFARMWQALADFGSLITALFSSCGIKLIITGADGND